jgi:uncharacterized protein YpmS
MIHGPIKQDTDYVELETGITYTVLAANEDGIIHTDTVLEVLGTEVPCVVYYSPTRVTKTIVCAETAFRERFRET